MILLISTGIYYWFGYQIQNNERFKLIKEANFDNVLLWWGDEFASSYSTISAEEYLGIAHEKITSLFL